MKLIPGLFPSNLPDGIRFERAKNIGAFAVYLPSPMYKGVDEFIGYIDALPNGYIHLYILAEYYEDNGELRPDIKMRLEKLLSNAPLVREYMVNADGILPIKHIRNL